MEQSHREMDKLLLLIGRIVFIMTKNKSVFQGGQFILNLVDFFVSGFVIFFLTILEVVGIIYVYGFKRVLKDIKFMLGIELGMYWKFCWIFLPVALSFFFIHYSITFETITYAGKSYPDAAISILIYRKKLISITLFRNKRFALNEMFQRNASKFAIFYV